MEREELLLHLLKVIIENQVSIMDALRHGDIRYPHIDDNLKERINSTKGVFDTSLAVKAGDEIMNAIEQYAAEKDKEIAELKSDVLYWKGIAEMPEDDKWNVDRQLLESELSAAKQRIVALEKAIARVFSKTECCKEDTVIASIRKDLNV